MTYCSVKDSTLTFDIWTLQHLKTWISASARRFVNTAKVICDTKQRWGFLHTWYPLKCLTVKYGILFPVYHYHIITANRSYLTHIQLLLLTVFSSLSDAFGFHSTFKNGRGWTTNTYNTYTATLGIWAPIIQNFLRQKPEKGVQLYFMPLWQIDSSSSRV